MIKPFYDDDGITLYCGDAREILPDLQPAATILTDPVWPNPFRELIGADRPYELFKETAVYFPKLCGMAVVQLGCNSDPRFLVAMPAEMPFLRVCWLEYVIPGARGRILYTGDVAYVFGTPPPSLQGIGFCPASRWTWKMESALTVKSRRNGLKAIILHRGSLNTSSGSYLIILRKGSSLLILSPAAVLRLWRPGLQDGRQSVLRSAKSTVK